MDDVNEAIWEQFVSGMTDTQSQVTHNRIQKLWDILSSSETFSINLRKLELDIVSRSAQLIDCYAVGSSIEVPTGMSESSDIDTLHIMRYITAYNSVSEIVECVDQNPFIVDQAGLHPCYYVLRVLEKYRRSMYISSFIKDTKIGPLLSAEVMKEYLHNHMPNLKLKKGSTALTGFRQGTDTDDVLAIKCPYWPRNIKLSFANRDRKWPTKDRIDVLMANTLFFVAKGHRYDKKYPECQWRLSFTMLEQGLFREMTNKQRLIFCIVKHMFKSSKEISTYAKNSENYALGSYIIKTVIFWEYEAEEQPWWNEHSLNDCVSRVLLSTIECLKHGKIEQYCLPENNLLDTVTQQACFEMAHLLHQCYLHRQMLIFAYYADNFGIIFQELNNLKSQPQKIIEMSEFEFQKCLDRFSIFHTACSERSIYKLSDRICFLYNYEKNCLNVVKNHMRETYKRAHLEFEDELFDLLVVIGIIFYIMFRTSNTASNKRRLLVLVIVKLSLIAQLPLNKTASCVKRKAAFYLIQIAFLSGFYDVAKYVCLSFVSLHNLICPTKLEKMLSRMTSYAEFIWLESAVSEIPFDIWPYIFYIRSSQFLGEAEPRAVITRLQKLCDILLDESNIAPDSVIIREIQKQSRQINMHRSPYLFADFIWRMYDEKHIKRQLNFFKIRLNQKSNLSLLATSGLPNEPALKITLGDISVKGARFKMNTRFGI